MGLTADDAVPHHSKRSASSRSSLQPSVVRNHRVRGWFTFLDVGDDGSVVEKTLFPSSSRLSRGRASLNRVEGAHAILPEPFADHVRPGP